VASAAMIDPVPHVGVLMGTPMNRTQIHLASKVSINKYAEAKPDPGLSITAPSVAPHQKCRAVADGIRCVRWTQRLPFEQPFLVREPDLLPLLKVFFA
jgi:hypothetical protein